jgi:riboflavin biosynthesis pyrimidine reductase
LHAAAWDEHLVDYVRLYITPHVLGDAGVPLLPDRSLSSAAASWKYDHDRGRERRLHASSIHFPDQRQGGAQP